MSTKLTMETSYSTVSVSIQEEDLSITKVIELVRQLLLGAGYHHTNVKDSLGED